MKATQRTQGFTPITITLETKEEAMVTWHKLNNTGFTEGYAERHADELPDNPADIEYSMWIEFDKVFHIG